MLSRVEETLHRIRKISDKTGETYGKTQRTFGRTVGTFDRIREISEGTVRTFEVTRKTYGLTGRNWRMPKNQVTQEKSRRQKRTCAVIFVSATGT
jgi:hypothetical protein